MKALSILLAAAVALAVPVSSFASADQATMKNARGSIATVDAAAKSLTLKLPGEAGKPAMELRMTVDDQTKIVKEGHAIQLSELQVGDEVQVSYRAAGASVVALNIGVQPKSE